MNAQPVELEERHRPRAENTGLLQRFHTVACEHYRQRAQQGGVNAEEHRQRQFGRTAKNDPCQADQQHQRCSTACQDSVVTGRPRLQPQGFVKQDHFKQFAVHREERQNRKAKSPATADQATFDVVLPRRSMSAVVHPHA